MTIDQNKTSAALAEVKEESSEIPKCQIFFSVVVVSIFLFVSFVSLY
ncbi:hypothetical protein [Calothrix sp. NIES-2100]